jgi:two-component sensor histidine kinase
VEDTGIGLPEKGVSGERTSLGMTIVETLAEQLEGRLEITSDRGSHFVLTLPLPA